MSAMRQAFYKTAESEKDFDSTTDDFSDGLFQQINHHHSQIHLLIGAKKFTEGWSSWRVSTMGLMNMGKSEGSQIIQLFGRGVRLKGHGFSLKRSLPDDRPKGIHLEKLETLNIFGINAGYMEQFKAYLREEGLTPPDEMLTLDFNVQTQIPRMTLKTLRIKDGYKDNQKLGFKRQERITLYEIPAKYQGKIKPIHVELDCYPQIEAIETQKKTATPLNQREHNRLDASLFDGFDWDAIYLQLLDHKLKRTWSNLALDKERLRQFAQQNDWYTLYIPASVLAVRQFADVLYQQNLLIQLLMLYTDAFYQRLKAAYEGQFYETVWVDENNPSLLKQYQFQIENSDDDKVYQQKLLALKNFIEQAQFAKAQQWQAQSMTAICFAPHLYYPIMTILKDDKFPVKMQPLAMNEASEIDFVNDLQQAYDDGKLQEWIGDKDIYLLRNAANKAKGLGFALAGNFYPDFLLWLVDKETDKQWLTFIDPKGIRQMSINDPKFGLADEIKKLEKDCAIDITLNSFILSVTNKKDAPHLQDISDDELKTKHILFMQERDYLKQMITKIMT
ncbi:hypothetical protein KRX11_06500 [Pasteurellaceae bacterium TAE3-ERU1]|nr:hypothetical protein [Pasteurellaceae bacterium TAE3-ERU1]